MTSWITYARPFVKRRNVYKRLIAKNPLSDHAFRCEDYITCIEYAWGEFVRSVIQQGRPDND